jgi:hypothetical protein
MLGKTSLFLSAALGLSLFSASQPASAQVIFVQRQPSVIVREQPSVIVREQPSVIVRQQPSVIVREQPSVIIRQQPAMITQEQRSVVTTESPSAVLERSVLVPTAIGPMSDFRHRLDLIRDQISLGLQNGSMNADAAADLSRRYSDLSAFANGLMSRLPISQLDNDSLEQQINLLNQDVSHAMGQ